MTTIGVGFIGLSQKGWGVFSHLPYLKGSDKYEIVAICNSSAESARAAIKTHGLPDTTKAYGNPDELAVDPNVDLVVCCVRVDKHFSTIAPALKAGKDVFVEWPLARNLAEAEGLLRLSREGKVKRTVVGLQGRQAPIITTLKKIIRDGRIGRVLSSSWVGQAGMEGSDLPERIKFVADVKIGATLVHILFAHAVDAIQQALGSSFESFNSLLANRHPFVRVLDDCGEVLDSHYPKTAPDHIMVHGVLANSKIPLSISFRGGDIFKGTPGLIWSIYGEKGEIRVTASTPHLHVIPGDQNIEIWDMNENTVEEVEILKDEIDTKGFHPTMRNVARIYEQFARGESNCTFEDAVERQRFIEEMLRQNGIDTS
ncbi:NAD-binding Rossmann fold oxidoreductase family protein [Xylogone sp. PMI_703]|nr:NAD-binding Rossmann fold oxidoreductase family protein [Xylogone sp. PMI_703]